MTAPQVRPARPEDAEGLAALINAIIVKGGTTAHRRPFDGARMTAHYIAPPRIISCRVAEDDEQILGFQALEWCDPDWEGPDPLPPDWAVIASFVGIGAQRRGVGRALWGATRAAALRAGVVAIDATIRADNAVGLAFYGALGFCDYGRLSSVPLSDGTVVDRIRKRFDLP